jgi:hypothetical protein
MQALLNQTELDPDDKLYLEFALGKACDDAGQFDAAFTYFKQGNQDKWAQTSYDHNGYVTFINSLMTTFDPGLFNRLNPCGTEDETPVFIIGMPRSGTSLIEQILAAHPDIHAGGEQAILESVFNEFFGADTFSSKISTATTEPFKKLGQRYIDGLRKLNPTARFITDKMPHNFHYVGLIALAMPNAKIIHCQRNPMDTCLSCFQKLFTTGHHYSYDLQDLGRHYLYYQKIMAYWHKLLPGKILDVRYEDVVNDME